MIGTAQIMQGNALNLPLADNTVDLICTSPPYFGLRSYQDGGEHYAGQIGAEATPAEFVDALIDATAEMVRVLKPSGSIFVNLGDKYSGAQQQTSGRQSGMTSAEYWARTNPKVTGVKAKSLYGIPWRYALRCIDDLGLILRAEDMSADYCRLATWRTTDRGQLATALQVEKPEPIHVDQLDLFGDDAA